MHTAPTNTVRHRLTHKYPSPAIYLAGRGSGMHLKWQKEKKIVRLHCCLKSIREQLPRIHHSTVVFHDGEPYELPVFVSAGEKCRHKIISRLVHVVSSESRQLPAPFPPPNKPKTQTTNSAAIGTSLPSVHHQSEIWLLLPRAPVVAVQNNNSTPDVLLLTVGRHTSKLLGMMYNILLQQSIEWHRSLF